jgi:hypothetical protein
LPNGTDEFVSCNGRAKSARWFFAGQTLPDEPAFLLAHQQHQHRVALAPGFLRRICGFSRATALFLLKNSTTPDITKKQMPKQLLSS